MLHHQVVERERHAEAQAHHDHIADRYPPVGVHVHGVQQEHTERQHRHTEYAYDTVLTRAGDDLARHDARYHDRHRHRRNRVTTRCRSAALYRLYEKRDIEHRAEESNTCHEHRDYRYPEYAVLEQVQRYDRFLGARLDEDE